MNPPDTVLRRIYLDNAAATPLDSRVFSVMEPYLKNHFGNASAIHTEGGIARSAITAARVRVAKTLAIQPDEIIFTGSGTESNNLAILGHLRYLNECGREYSSMEVITTHIEHPSIMELVPELKKRGVHIQHIPVTECGEIAIASLRAQLSPKTVLVTFSYVNSEIGVIQPVSQLVRAIRQYAREEQTSIFVHVDAAQAPLWLPCKLEGLGVDALALDAAKFGGPKGVGILAVRKPETLHSVLFGGGQERGIRPGTENVAGIVGAACGLALAQDGYQARAEKVSEVRDAGIRLLRESFPIALLNGPEGALRVANNINISIPAYDTEYAVVFLDAAGIAASTKSACAGSGSGVSQVVLSCTQDTARAKATLRFTLSEDTTVADLEVVVAALQRFTKTMQPLAHKPI